MSEHDLPPQLLAFFGGIRSPGRRAVRDACAGRIVWRSRILRRVDGLLQTVGVQTYVKPPHAPFYDELGFLRSVPNLGGVRTDARGRT